MDSVNTNSTSEVVEQVKSTHGQYCAANTINAFISYVVWFPKTQEGKNVGHQSYESTKPDSKIPVRIDINPAMSFELCKRKILAEIAISHANAATLLRAAEDATADLPELKWYAYISGTRSYPMTGDRVVVITSDLEWLQWISSCDASRDKVCGVNLVMQNPVSVQKKRKQEESLLIQATKIKRRQTRHVANQAKKNNKQHLTPEEMALDKDAEQTNDHQTESGESTGGDTDTDVLKIVADEIYKKHPIKADYDRSTPVYVDPQDTNKFFYITAGMSRIWARAKLDCDAKGSKVVTLDIPPKAGGIKWLSRSAEMMKRTKGSGVSTNQDFGNLMAQLVTSIQQPHTGVAEATSGAVLKAPLARYLNFCEIVDLDGSVEARLTEAGFDQYDLFDQTYLPRDDLVKLNLRPGDITRLYKNVNRFAKIQDLEQKKQRGYRNGNARVEMNHKLVRWCSTRLNTIFIVIQPAQPQRTAKLGIKIYHQPKLSFAAGPRKNRRKPFRGGVIPWVHPKRYPRFYKDLDELPDPDIYLFLTLNRNRKNSTASKRLRWKQEDQNERKDLDRWTQANMKVWRSEQQAEAHKHFFFLKGALADVQNNGPTWLFTPANHMVANKVLRESSNAEKYHALPVEERKQWLEEKMIQARTN
ncbi:uncharacterized protein MELLADRAFT_95840 [Melampsora larici-populina 98AG31]|uniref:Uncharacterized protein n=1 Tax=Melampsora larici-populina (strain 98AG31 / pathotype 3-4-7) TaxID=747676 RepID=F4RDF7_MELLP|nr:uncharacterized protein MELLADRAFT_95840 [Melampsora larici-populina 98AG31]EGG09616.1 hypothetical protein MELLADRAFT_95840 [Melampsora larici-populina 98AG31]